MAHGGSGLLLAYALVVVSLFVTLARTASPGAGWLRSALLALPLTVVAGLANALVTSLLRGLGMTGEGLLRLLVGAAVCVATGRAGGLLLARAPASNVWYRRGAVVTDGGASMTEDRGSSITLAGIPVALQDEFMHFKCVGTTGTGKSTAIREMLRAALARGDRAIIADPDGGYLRDFHDAGRGDLILNPFDPGSVRWSLLGEISTDYDVDQLARSLIPDGAGSDRVWNGYARTFFTAVIQRAVALGLEDDAEVFRLITQAPAQELKLLLADTFAAPFLEDGNEKMFGSLRSVTTSAIFVLRYILKQTAAPFSIRQWIRQGAARRDGGRGGVLFIPYKAGEIAALRSVISAWMRIAIFEAMHRPEGDQRLWFVVDELDALGEIDGLKDALARLRKFGGRCVLGFQSISQVSSTYGRGVADTIVENCGNSLILRCSASEQGGTSQFASRLVGQREVVHVMRSRSRRPTDWLASTTHSEQRSIEPAVMASEIERLPNLEGFLKFASNPDWLRVTLEPARK